MKRVVTFGELLLSLIAEGQNRLVQAGAFTARYTGAEANVAVSLAQFGLEAFAVSKVPGHEVGQASINALRRFGVNTQHIARGGDRLGLLYLEQGTAQRPAKVIYDRAASSFRQLRPADLDWDAILAGKDWLHFSGTAPAAGAAVVEVLNAGLATARRLGMTVSCDCNYRSKLWSRQEAGRTLAPLLEHVQVLICGRDDPRNIFGVGPEHDQRPEGPPGQRAAEALRQRFGLQAVAMTFRDGCSAAANQYAANHYAAMLCQADGAYLSRQHEVQIVDRIGTGDAFAAGLIFGLLSGFEPQPTIEFAAAAACLKHSIPGDFNLASREEVEQLLAGARPGCVQR